VITTNEGKNSMNTHTISRVEARRPAPFTATPTLAMVLAAQAGTGAHYVQRREPGESMEMLTGEAQALEMQGEIDGDTLARDWTLVQGESPVEAEMADENVVEAYAIAEGPELVLEEMEEEVEPLV